MAYCLSSIFFNFLIISISYRDIISHSFNRQIPNGFELCDISVPLKKELLAFQMVSVKKIVTRR